MKLTRTLLTALLLASLAVLQAVTPNRNHQPGSDR